jgi:hypothetical protein
MTPALVERDPENRLLARGPRYRWSSGVLRDQALAASGLLVDQMGGPSVKPYQPAGVWEEMSFGNIRYEQDHGSKLYRRSVYTFWRRTVGPTEFFDTASRQVCTVRQSRTNTPLHALTLLNDPTYVEAARALAERALRQPFPSPPERVAWMFRVVTSRLPSDSEQQVLTARLAQLKAHYAANQAAAAELIHTGESEPQVETSPAELAAHASIALVLFNLDETLNKE